MNHGKRFVSFLQPQWTRWRSCQCGLCVGVSFNPCPPTRLSERSHSIWIYKLRTRQMWSITAISGHDRLCEIRVGLFSPVNRAKVELEQESCFTVIAFWLHNNTASGRKANSEPFCYGGANMICDMAYELWWQKSLNWNASFPMKDSR